MSTTLVTRRRDPETGRYLKPAGPLETRPPEPMPASQSVNAAARLTLDPWSAIQQFDLLIHKMARGCARRLPPGSMYGHDDLYQEGAIQVMRCLERYDPSRGQAKFMTYLTVSLQNRFGLIVHNEWAKRGWHDDDPDNRVLNVASALADQAEVDVLLDWARTGRRRQAHVLTPHVYRDLLPAR